MYFLFYLIYNTSIIFVAALNLVCRNKYFFIPMLHFSNKSSYIFCLLKAKSCLTKLIFKRKPLTVHVRNSLSTSLSIASPSSSLSAFVLHRARTGRMILDIWIPFLHRFSSASCWRDPLLVHWLMLRFRLCLCRPAECTIITLSNNIFRYYLCLL